MTTTHVGRRFAIAAVLMTAACGGSDGSSADEHAEASCEAMNEMNAISKEITSALTSSEEPDAKLAADFEAAFKRHRDEAAAAAKASMEYTEFATVIEATYESSHAQDTGRELEAVDGRDMVLKTCAGFEEPTE
jgi:hypothetical protein